MEDAQVEHKAPIQTTSIMIHFRQMEKFFGSSLFSRCTRKAFLGSFSSCIEGTREATWVLGWLGSSAPAVTSETER